MSFAGVMRSSDVRALGDDARKDDDNVAFLAELPVEQQAEWLARLRWVRVADRFAENELLEPSARRFSAFREEWRAFADGGPCAGEHAASWREMRACWWSPAGEVCAPRAIACFGEYLEALHEYTRPGLELRTLAEHDRMCERYGRSVFGVFPYLLDAQRAAAGAFGTFDQALNNLRDLQEDVSHGLCFFPADVLARFGVVPGSLMDGSAIGTSGYHAMMSFWVDEHLASMRERAAAFAFVKDLHPSLRAMRKAFSTRHERILRVFRACSFDYVAFAREYWKAAERRVA